MPHRHRRDNQLSRRPTLRWPTRRSARTSDSLHIGRCASGNGLDRAMCKRGWAFPLARLSAVSIPQELLREFKGAVLPSSSSEAMSSCSFDIVADVWSTTGASSCLGPGPEIDVGPVAAVVTVPQAGSRRFTAVAALRGLGVNRGSDNPIVRDIASSRISDSPIFPNAVHLINYELSEPHVARRVQRGGKPCSSSRMVCQERTEATLTCSRQVALIRNTTLSRPTELSRVPSRMPPIFSTARCERKLLGPTRKITLVTKRNACASMSRFISPLKTPPQCERARNVQPISISLFASSYPK